MIFFFYILFSPKNIKLEIYAEDVSGIWKRSHECKKDWEPLICMKEDDFSPSAPGKEVIPRISTGNWPGYHVIQNCLVFKRLSTLLNYWPIITMEDVVSDRSFFHSFYSSPLSFFLYIIANGRPSDHILIEEQILCSKHIQIHMHILPYIQAIRTFLGFVIIIFVC